VTHTYTFGTVFPTTVAIIDYPENYQGVMSTTCAYSDGSCFVFPNQRRVVTISTLSTSTTTLVITALNNGIYVQPPSTISFVVSSDTTSTLNKFSVVHSPFNTLQTILSSGNPTAIDIINVQTIGGVFLRNYWNTVKIDLTGIFTN
jgi:hypothetical protein